MFVKQIDRKTALELLEKGHEIPIMVPDGPNWENYYPTTLSVLLDGCLFFRKEPAEVDPDFEAAAESSEIAEKPTSSADAKSKQNQKKSVDAGKILALREAGWSMKKIADEVKVSEGTVFNYLKKFEESKNEKSK